MFDLYEIKIEIKTSMKALDVSPVEEEVGEKQFVEHVRKIHANLTKME